MSKTRIGLLAAAFVMVILALEVAALQIGSLPLDLSHPPALAEDPGTG